MLLQINSRLVLVIVPTLPPASPATLFNLKSFTYVLATVFPRFDYIMFFTPLLSNFFHSLGFELYLHDRNLVFDLTYTVVVWCLTCIN